MRLVERRRDFLWLLSLFGSKQLTCHHHVLRCPQRSDRFRDLLRRRFYRHEVREHYSLLNQISNLYGNANSVYKTKFIYGLRLARQSEDLVDFEAAEKMAIEMHRNLVFQPYLTLLGNLPQTCLTASLTRDTISYFSFMQECSDGWTFHR